MPREMWYLCATPPSSLPQPPKFPFTTIYPRTLHTFMFQPTAPMSVRAISSSLSNSPNNLLSQEPAQFASSSPSVNPDGFPSHDSSPPASSELSDYPDYLSSRAPSSLCVGQLIDFALRPQALLHPEERLLAATDDLMSSSPVSAFGPGRVGAF